MADRVIHVILSEHPGYGWSVESPQLPGLVGGRESLVELEADLIDLLQFGGAPEEYRLVRHWQRHFADEDGQWAVRWVVDRHANERAATAQRLLHCMTVPKQKQDLLTNVHTPYDELLFVSMLPADKLALLFDQMDPRGDAVTVVLPLSDVGVWSMQFAYETAGFPVDWSSIKDYGLNPDTTVGEAMTRMDALPSQQRALVLA